MMPLSMIEKNSLVRVVKISGGRGLVLRLINMGIKENKIVRVLNNGNGPVLIAVDNARVALGRGASFKVFVEYVKED